jgi:hypothetical protein
MLAGRGGPPLIVNGTASVATANAQTLTTTNAIGSVTFVLTTNAAGNSTCDSTGHYVAGDTGGGGQFSAVVDRVTATDSVGHTAFIDITVVATLPSDVTWTVILDANAIVGKNDGDTITSWANTGSAGTNATVAGGFAAPTYKTGIINGKPVVRCATTGSHSLELASLALSDCVVNNLYYAYVVGINNYAGAFAGGGGGPGFFHHTSGYCTIVGLSATSAKHYFGYNWDGNEDNTFDTANTLATGSAVLVGQRHLSGNIELQKGGGAAWGDTTASGNTQVITGKPEIGGTAALSASVDIGAILVTKASLTTSQQTRTVNFLRSEFGASL